MRWDRKSEGSRRPARAFALGLIFLLVHEGAKAQSRAVMGGGVRGCAELVRAQGNLSLEYQYKAWIDGYLSGYNVASQETDILLPLARASNSGTYEWIVNPNT
jgi:hypothetical protein